MDRMDVYDAWVGPDNPWEIWVKPAVFASLDQAPAPEPPWPNIDVRWAPPAGQGTFFLVDLDGAASIELGLALTSRGYRPIVSINTIAEPGAAVDMEGVSEALRLGARHPEAFPIDAHAPPAFLLDARRMSPTRPPGVGVLDNRWMIFRQDLPSAALLRKRRLTRVVVVRHHQNCALAEDLQLVLHAWQEGGIEICARDVDRDLPVEPMKIEAPSWIRRLLGPVRPARLGDGPRREPLPPTPSHG